MNKYLLLCYDSDMELVGDDYRFEAENFVSALQKAAEIFPTIPGNAHIEDISLYLERD